MAHCPRYFCSVEKMREKQATPIGRGRGISAYGLQQGILLIKSLTK